MKSNEQIFAPEKSNDQSNCGLAWPSKKKQLGMAPHPARRDVKWLAGEFVSKTTSKRMKFSEPKMVEWPKEALRHCATEDLRDDGVIMAWPVGCIETMIPG